MGHFFSAVALGYHGYYTQTLISPSQDGHVSVQIDGNNFLWAKSLVVTIIIPGRITNEGFQFLPFRFSRKYCDGRIISRYFYCQR